MNLAISQLKQEFNKNAETKIKLCEKALEFIPSTGVIYLDSGSTHRTSCPTFGETILAARLLLLL